jgi:acylphosphatase
VLGDENGMTAVRRLLAVVPWEGGRQPFGDQVARVAARSLGAVQPGETAVAAAEMEAGTERAAADAVEELVHRRRRVALPGERRLDGLDEPGRARRLLERERPFALAAVDPDGAGSDTLRTMRRRVILHGNVQGVGLRYSVARAAEGRGLGGWIRNCADGTVEAAFEGDEADVDALVRYCEYGSRGANVFRVETYDEEPEGLAAFEIR